MVVDVSKDYEVVSPFAAGHDSDVYLVKDKSDEQKYLLKTLRDRDAQSASNALRLKLRFTNEIDIVSTLRHPHISKIHKTFSHEDNFSLIYPYKEGVTLAALLKDGGALPQDQCLNLIGQLLEALDYLHAKGIVHCDLNPNNIFVSSGNHLEIFDFGFSLQEKHISSQLDNQIIGTIPYLAPEQTGFTNFKIDNRTDLFSAAIILYQMLSGKLPFDGSQGNVKQYLDQLLQTELEPMREVPIALNQILLKALNPNPEERYQTADGFNHDLTMVSGQIDNGAALSLGEKDRILAATRKKFFVGREAHLDALTGGLKNLRQRKGGAYLLYGISGIGKTEIVREFQKVLGKDQVSITIKCNQFTASQPFSVVRISILEFLSHINNLDAVQFEATRTAITDALIEHSGVLCKNVPELSSLFKTVKEDVTVEREQERLIHVLHLLIKEFAKLFPVVLHVDDIQWTDKTSFDVLKKCLNESMPLLLIMNYRTAKPDEEPYLYQDSILKLEFEKTMQVQPFSNRELRSYVSACFEPLRNGDELVRTLALKTDNTPFSFSEAVRLLVRESLISFEEESWNFDAEGWLAKTKKLDPVSLIERKFDLANAGEKRYLQIASLLGGRFHPDTVIDLKELPPGNPQGFLDQLEKLRFVSRGYKGQYHFTHDKIHETISTAIPKEEALRLNEKIGDLFKEKSGKKRKSIFNAAEHYLKSGNVTKAMETCFRAATYAKEQMGHDLAVRYYKMCLLLEQTPDKTTIPQPYNSTQVKLNLADIYVLTGKNNEALKLLSPLKSESPPTEVSVEIYYKLGVIHSNLADMEKATEHFMVSLKGSGIRLPKNRLLITLGLIWNAVRMYLPGSFLLLSPKMKGEPKALFNLKILNKMSFSYFFTDLSLCILTHLKAFNLARRMPLSYEKIETFTMHTVPAFQFFLKKRAYKYAYKSVKLSKDLGRKDLISFSKCFAGFVHFYDSKWNKAEELFYSSVNGYRSIGDAWGELFSYEQLWLLNLHKGDFLKLNELIVKTKTLSEDCPDQQSILQRHFIELFLKSVTNEKVNSESAFSSIPELEKTESIMTRIQCAAHTAKALLVNDEYEKAHEILQSASETILRKKMMQEYITSVFVHLSSSITKRRLAIESSEKKFAPTVKGLHKEWKQSLFNLYIRSSLFKAYKGAFLRSCAWLQYFGRRYKLASILFKMAIKKHKRLDMKYEEAQSHRDYAIFLEKINRPDLAREEYEKSYHLFRHCGAILEFKKIENKVINPLSADDSLARESSSSTNRLQSFSFELGQIRINSLLDVSQSITQFQDMDLLMRQLLSALIQVTAAQKGYLFLEESEHSNAATLFLDYEGNELTLSQITFSRSISESVRKNQEAYVTPDGSQEHLNDANSENIKSVLCFPFIRNNVYLGQVYLCHDKITGLFGEESEKAAKIIAAQTSILLENAQYLQKVKSLNQNLEHQVEKQTQSIKEKNKKLEDSRLRLMESERMRGLLTGTLVHDIKNYLTGVEGNLRVLLRKFQDEPKGLRNIRAASEACLDIMALTSNLLDIGKMEEGKLELKKQWINFAEIIELVKKIQRTHLFEEKKLKLNIIPPQEGFEVEWDPVLLVRVLQNLLNNAAKYTPEHGEVRVELGETQRGRTLSIFNSGEPLAPEFKEKLFEKYSRVDGKWSQYSKGMGLYFCKMVVQAHGGDIWLDTVEDGNYFRIGLNNAKKVSPDIRSSVKSQA